MKKNNYTFQSAIYVDKESYVYKRLFLFEDILAKEKIEHNTVEGATDNAPGIATMLRTREVFYLPDRNNIFKDHVLSKEQKDPDLKFIIYECLKIEEIIDSPGAAPHFNYTRAVVINNLNKPDYEVGNISKKNGKEQKNILKNEQDLLKIIEIFQRIEPERKNIIQRLQEDDKDTELTIHLHDLANDLDNIKNIVFGNTIQGKEMQSIQQSIREINAPEYYSMLDNLPKKIAFDPNNRTNENGIVEFTKSNNNPIRVGKNLTTDLIIQPSNMISLESSKKGIVPLNRFDDVVIDAICSYIIENSKPIGDIFNPKCIDIIRKNLFPLELTEFEVTALIYATEKPTKKQREQVTSNMMILTSTPHYFEWIDVAQAYNEKRKKNPKEQDKVFTDSELENTLKVKVKTNVIEGRIEERTNPNKTRSVRYVILDIPAFLEHAIMTGQIKSIPKHYIASENSPNDNNFILAKNYIAKIVGDADNRLSKNKDLKNSHTAILLSTLFEKTGIKFTGSQPRVKRARFIKKLNKYLKELVKKSDHLVDFKIIPEEPRKPKEAILLVYKTKRGKVIKSNKF